MTHATPGKRLPVRVVVIWGMLLAHSFCLAAQEPTPPHPEQPEQRNAQERKGQGRAVDLMTELQQRHEARKKLRQEMTQAVQQQLTALREHTKALEALSDEPQLLGEIKKHLQLTDALLGTLVEQRARLDAALKERREQLWRHLGQTPQPEQTQPEGHEVCPEGE